MKLKTFLVCLVGLLACCLTSSVYAGFPKSNLGTYVYTGGDAQKDAFGKAVKAISDKVGFFFRGRVHNGLLKAFAIKDKLSFQAKGKSLLILAKGRKTIPLHVNGKPKTITTKKGSASLTCTFSNNTLTETLRREGKKGYRTNQYTFSKDGKTITLVVSAYLSRLKKTLTFSLTYSKK
ncbi:MAG: hypothetical protein EP343_02830 [Deltaproteobacteria bacterium]|nr:MAG: hypothetical protein EP343_02830 [Deltaproteobacteria bacterium]